jgi:hypothetical protein
MAQKSPDEDPLVNFLHQYRPLPPQESQGFESQLMKLIAQESQASIRFPRRLGGLIGGAICTGFLLFLGGFRSSNDTPQVARVSDRELKTFLIDSWDGAMGETSNYRYSHSIESAWQINHEPQLTYSNYQP